MIFRRDGACPVFLANANKPSLHQYSVSFLFRGSEEDKDFELFLDVVEPMLQFSFDENN